MDAVRHELDLLWTQMLAVTTRSGCTGNESSIPGASQGQRHDSAYSEAYAEQPQRYFVPDRSWDEGRVNVWESSNKVASQRLNYGTQSSRSHKMQLHGHGSIHGEPPLDGWAARMTGVRLLQSRLRR